MELQEFVRDALSQITAAVQEANESNKSKQGDRATSFSILGTSERDGISFDVALTVEDQGKLDSGGKLKVAVGSFFGAESGKAGEVLARRSEVSRVQFRVTAHGPYVAPVAVSARRERSPLDDY